MIAEPPPAGAEPQKPAPDRHATDGHLAADGINLSADVLDRIDEIVPPGVTINVADNMWNFGTTALDAAYRRR